MAINIKVENPAHAPSMQQPEEIKVSVGPQREMREKQAGMFLNARKTIDSNVLIFDHNDIDIVLMPTKNKVVTFAKDSFGDHVYEAQDRFFKYLVKRGVVEFDSVRGGNIFSSMEAIIPESQDYNSTQLVLFTISKFIENEKPLMEYEEAFAKEEEERLSQPLPGESTEFDPDKYHAVKKGSIRPGIQPYGLSSVYRL